MSIPNAERTQFIKWESTSEGGGQNDEYPTGCNPNQDALEARGLYYQIHSNDPPPGVRDEEVYTYRDGDNLKFRDKVETTEIALSQILTEPKHEILDTLVHELSENFYLEVTRTSGRISSVVVWTDAGKTVKIREILISRNSIGKISQLVTKQYDALGVLKQTLTETLSRLCGRVSSIAAVET